jgi:hypothetical protein
MRRLLKQEGIMDVGVEVYSVFVTVEQIYSVVTTVIQVSLHKSATP